MDGENRTISDDDIQLLEMWKGETEMKIADWQENEKNITGLKREMDEVSEKMYHLFCNQIDKLNLANFDATYQSYKKYMHDDHRSKKNIKGIPLLLKMKWVQCTHINQ